MIVNIYYDRLSGSNTPTARESGGGNAFIQYYMTVFAIVTNIWQADEFQYILSIYMVGSTQYIFDNYYNHNPFFDTRIRTAWKIYSSLLLWMALMTVLAKILEGQLFKEIIVCSLQGLVCISIVSICNREVKIEVLLLDPNSVFTDVELIKHINYVIYLFKQSKFDTNANTFLDGFLEIHSQMCYDDECVLKKRNEMNKTILIETDNSHNTIQLGETEQEIARNRLIICLLNQLYTEGLKKFMGSTNLLVCYSLFLFEDCNNLQQAMIIIEEVGNHNPSFDQEFMIYRIKLLIEEILLEQNSTKDDNKVFSDIHIQSQWREIQFEIEKCTIMHLDFWSQLTDEIPDQIRQHDLGIKILIIITSIERHWKKLSELGELQKRFMLSYGRFLQEILHDQDQATMIFNAHSNSQMANSGHSKLNVTSEGLIADLSIPTLVASGDIDRLGIITSCNTTAASIFGYNKGDLINKCIKTLMPSIYSKTHDGHLERYLITNQMKFSKNERRIYGKHKNGYVFQVLIDVKPFHNNLQYMQFIAKFRISKYFKQVSNILVWPDGTIDGITSSCIPMLQIDLKILQKKNNIENYMPGLLENIDSYKGTCGGIYFYKYPTKESNNYHSTPRKNTNMTESRPQFANGVKVQSNAELDNSSGKYSNSNEQKKTFQNGMASQIHKSTIVQIGSAIDNTSRIIPSHHETLIDSNENDGLQSKTEGFTISCQASALNVGPNSEPGFMLKFDHVKKSFENKNLKRKHKPCSFQFRYNISKGCIIGEFTDNLVDDLLSDDGGYNVFSENDFITDDEHATQVRDGTKDQLNDFVRLKYHAEKERLKKIEDSNKVFIDFGQGIKIQRLHRGKIEDILNDGYSDSEDELVDTIHDSIDKNNSSSKGGGGMLLGDDYSWNQRMFQNTFTTKKSYVEALMVNNTPKIVKIQNIFGHAMLLCLLTIIIIDYVLTLSNFSLIKDNMQLIEEAHIRMFEMNNIINYVLKLNLLHNGIIMLEGATASQAEALYKSNITASITEIQRASIALQIENFQIPPSQEHRELLETNYVKMIHKEGDVFYYDLDEATKVWISRALIVKEQPLASITKDNPSDWYITYNGLNDLLLALRSSADFIILEFKDYTQQEANSFQIIMISTQVFQFMSVFIIILILIRIDSIKHQLIELFQDIDDKNIKSVYNKIEKYLAQLQVLDEDQGEIDSDQQDQGEFGDDKNDMIDKSNQDELNNSHSRIRRKKKKIKRVKKITQKLNSLCLIILWIGALAAYFIYNYTQSWVFLNDCNTVSLENNSTLGFSSYMYFVKNSEMELTQSEGQLIINQLPEKTVRDSINYMYMQASILEEEHTKNSEIHTETYKTQWSEVFMSKTCDILIGLNLDKVSQPECIAFGQGTVNQGLAVGLSQHYEKVRKLYAYYYRKYDDQSIPWAEAGVTCPTVAGLTQEQNNKLCINLLPDSLDADEFIRGYLKDLMSYISEKLVDEKLNQYDTLVQMRLVIFLIVLGFITIMYFVAWLRLIKKSYMDIVKTRQLLTQIPLSIVGQSGGIRMFVRKFLNENDIKDI